MKRRIGILTSGGDCPGLNAAIRGVAKAAYSTMEDVEILGITDGYSGLIYGEAREMKQADFSNILTLGGTILGTSRQPFKTIRTVGGDEVDKVEAMKRNYAKWKLDCLVTLGGNGTHKTANLLSQEGLNVVGLPKTIDNDIWGTEVTFGFQTAVDIATDVIDRIRTTAQSHRRCMVIELMGNKAGWLTLHAGLAGGADMILLPEMPYSLDAVCDFLQHRTKKFKEFSIICVAEGAMDREEAEMKRKDRAARRAQNGEVTVTTRLAREIQQRTGMETRTVVPGHIQRGGSPNAYDRVLATQLGVHAAKLIREGQFGTTVAVVGGAITQNPLLEVAGKTKLVLADGMAVKSAQNTGVFMGV